MTDDIRHRVDAGLRAEETAISPPLIGDVVARIRRRRSRRRGAVAVVGIASLIAVAAGLIADDGANVTVISIDRPPPTDPVVDCLVADAPCPGDIPETVPIFGSGEQFSIAAALHQIPVSDGVRDGVLIEVFDVLAASDASGNARPTGSIDDLEVFTWLAALSGESPSVFIVPPEILFARADRGGIGEYRDEVGFSINDVDATISTNNFIGLSIGTPDITVIAGDVQPNADIEVADGVFSIGEGEDQEINPLATTAARPLGRPIRVGSLDGLVAMSRSTAAVSAWHDPESERFSSDEGFAEAAEILDDRDVIGAVLVRTDSSSSADDRSVTPFDVIAFGWGLDGDRAAITFIFITLDDASAQTASSQVESAFRELSTADVRNAGPMIVDNVTTEGRAVVVSVSLPDNDSQPRTPYILFLTDELILSYTP